MITYLAIGGNIAPRRWYIAATEALVRERVGKVLVSTPLCETEAWGFAAPPFLNRILRVETALSAEELLEVTQGIERELGRTRHEGAGYESRPVDVDILLYGDTVIETEHLQVPHGRMHLRRFILEPLVALSPELVDPRDGTLWRNRLPLLQAQPALVEIPSIHHSVRLYADGGSTSTKWAMANGDRVEFARTESLNPLFVPPAEAKAIIGRVVARLGVDAGVVEAVHFYGANCGEGQQGHLLGDTLRALFPNASVGLGSDLEAAGCALWGDQPGAVAIVGTGSNAALYDGSTTRNLTPSLGYMMGDEASGAWFGKRLLRDSMYGELPEALEREVRGLLHQTLGEGASGPLRGQQALVERVYSGQGVSLFLASLFPVLLRHGASDYGRRLLHEGFGLFARFFVRPLVEAGYVELRAVGSVAYLCQEVFREECERVGASLTQVLQQPIYRMATHLESIHEGDKVGR